MHNKSKSFSGFDNLKDQAIDVMKPVECVNLLQDLLKEILRIDSEEKYAEIVIEELDRLKHEYPA